MESGNAKAVYVFLSEVIGGLYINIYAAGSYNQKNISGEWAEVMSTSHPLPGRPVFDEVDKVDPAGRFWTRLTRLTGLTRLTWGLDKVDEVDKVDEIDQAGRFWTRLTGQ